MTLICVAMSAGIDLGMNFNASSPLYTGSYSGCTKNITKVENQKNRNLSAAYSILQLNIIATLIVVYILPVLVVLPMGGGGTRMRGSRCHTDNTSQSETQMVGKGLKKRARSRPNGDENDDSPGNKKPRKVGRPQNFANHVCKDCTIWSQSGSHPNLQAYH